MTLRRNAEGVLLDYNGAEGLPKHSPPTPEQERENDANLIASQAAVIREQAERIKQFEAREAEQRDDDKPLRLHTLQEFIQRPTV